MSDERFYPLDLPVRRPYRLERRGEFVDAIPSADDVPVGIRVKREGSLVGIVFVYPRQSSEAIKRVDHKFMSADIGTNSGRLIGMRIDGKRFAEVVKSVKEGGEVAAEREIKEFLTVLHNEILALRKLDDRIGPSVNYELAARGLAPTDVSAPPSWLIDAMQSKSIRPSGMR